MACSFPLSLSASDVSFLQPVFCETSLMRCLFLQTEPVSCFTLAHLIIRLHRCLASGGWAGLSTTRRSFCSPTHPPLTKTTHVYLSHTLSPMRPRETRTFPKRSFKKSDRCPRVLHSPFCSCFMSILVFRFCVFRFRPDDTSECEHMCCGVLIFNQILLFWTFITVLLQFA